LPVDLDEIIRFPVDIKAPLGNVIEDVEGLALYVKPDMTGYLIASNQGNNEFLVYERTGDNGFLGSFRIQGGNGVDGVTETDGIDATSAALGSDFEDGLLVVQDDEDDRGNQNFKYVRWADVAEALGLD
jgi:3-phytase